MLSWANRFSVSSRIAANRLGPSRDSFSPFPSTLPSFASSLLNTSSNNLRANRFGKFVSISYNLSFLTPRLEDPIKTPFGGGPLQFSSEKFICDPSREKGAYPNFTPWLFSRSWP